MTAHSGDVCRSARFWATCRAGSVVVVTVSLFLVWPDIPSARVWGAPSTVPCCRALAGYSQCGSDRLDRTGCSALPPWGATCGRLFAISFLQSRPNDADLSPRTPTINVTCWDLDIVNDAATCGGHCHTSYDSCVWVRVYFISQLDCRRRFLLLVHNAAVFLLWIRHLAADCQTPTW